MYCPECGKQIEDNSKFCRYCGNQISANVSSPARAEAKPRPAPVGNQSNGVAEVNPWGKKYWTNLLIVFLIAIPIMIFIFFACILSGRGSSSFTNTIRGSITPVTYVTIDGITEDGSILPTVNLWDNYEQRNRVVAKPNHSAKVKYIKREGDGVLVEYNGKQGWCTYWFIREFK